MNTQNSNRAGRSETVSVCMPTLSAFHKQAFRVGLWEAQQVLATCAEVDLVELEASRGFAWKERQLHTLIYHDRSRKLSSLNPGLRRVRLTRDYDVFIMVCPLWLDVWYANCVERWWDHCQTSICWIDEMWAHEVPKLRYWLPVLSRFDHIFVGVGGTGPVLAEALNRECHQIFGAVDTLRFTPLPRAPGRVIDVHSIGRRVQPIHQELLKLVYENGVFYVHDTLNNTGNSIAPSYREHRDMYASMVKRARLFMVASGKVDAQQDTFGQASLGFRYFEGAAAGAVLLGQAPIGPDFQRHFDWEDALLEIRLDGSDTRETVTDLLADPARLDRISIANAAQCLRRHDWIHRWIDVFDLAGLRPTQGMRDRASRLSDLADAALEAQEI